VARAVVVIPARYGSTRFPGKVLAAETGRPLIQHVYERAALASCVDEVIVATDDDRIRRATQAFGGRAIMTRSDHPNGTCRIAEVAESIDADLIVNVQGDEPELEPALIDLAVRALVDDPDCPMSTAGSPFAPDEDPADENIVKVVVNRRGRAMYFSRSLIPFDRGAPASSGPRAAGVAAPLKHIGLYVYRRPFLAQYVRLEPTPLERTERLEQLRALEHGYDIAVALGEAHHHGIDTPQQYAAFVARWRQQP